MKKGLTISTATVLCCLAATRVHATTISLTVDRPYQTISSGSATTIRFTGTLIATNYDAFTMGVYDLYTADKVKLGACNYGSLYDALDLGLRTRNCSYTGDLFTVDVPADVLPGDYSYNEFHNKLALEFNAFNKDTMIWYPASQGYGVKVEASSPSVPGPAAALPAVLGLVAGTLKRRVRRSA